MTYFWIAILVLKDERHKDSSVYWSHKNSTDPSAIRTKSANPWTMTLRSLFSIAFGSTVNTGGKLLSPSGNTFLLHSFQVILRGAWMACLTSCLSKYMGVWICLCVPLVYTAELDKTKGVRTEDTHGRPRTSQRTGNCKFRLFISETDRLRMR